jgi:hypothetical protein
VRTRARAKERVGGESYQVAGKKVAAMNIFHREESNGPMEGVQRNSAIATPESGSTANACARQTLA